MKDTSVRTCSVIGKLEKWYDTDCLFWLVWSKFDFFRAIFMWREERFGKIDSRRVCVFHMPTHKINKRTSKAIVLNFVNEYLIWWQQIMKWGFKVFEYLNIWHVLKKIQRINFNDQSLFRIKLRITVIFWPFFYIRLCYKAHRSIQIIKNGKIFIAPNGAVLQRNFECM